MLSEAMDGATEEWRPIAGYEGLYEVSNLGRIRRLPGTYGCKHGRILKQCRDKDGYHQVDLSKNNERETRRVHQAVALAFLGPCPLGHTVNHKLGIKSRNGACDLDYLTVGDQNRHAAALKLGESLCGSEHPGSKITEADVSVIRALKGKMLQREIAAVFGIHKSTVGEIHRREIWAHVA